LLLLQSTLVKQLSNEPELGFSLGSNLFKIRLRISSKGKGKSGGARVITFLIKQEREIYWVAIYDKSELETLSRSRIKDYLKAAGLL
jgi:hypothetical protein